MYDVVKLFSANFSLWIHACVATYWPIIRMEIMLFNWLQEVFRLFASVTEQNNDYYLWYKNDWNRHLMSYPFFIFLCTMSLTGLSWWPSFLHFWLIVSRVPVSLGSSDFPRTWISQREISNRTSKGCSGRVTRGTQDSVSNTSTWSLICFSPRKRRRLETDAKITRKWQSLGHHVSPQIAERSFVDNCEYQQSHGSNYESD